MEDLPNQCATRERRAIPKVTSVVVLLVISAAFSSAASITDTYRTSFVVSDRDPSAPGELLLPIARFERKLGHFGAATIDLIFDGEGMIGYGCEPYGDCGEWVWDEDTGMQYWEPNPYPYDLSWNLGVSVWILSESGPNAHIVEANLGPFGSSRSENWFWFGSDRKLTFAATSSDAVFAADTPLTLFLDLELSTDAPDHGIYIFNDAYFAGDMTATVRYDYEPVPEPSVWAMTFVGMSLLFLRKLTSSVHRSNKLAAK